MDLVEEVEENAAGCDAKRDNIRQGIQLFSDGGRYSQKPCREAIEEVKGGSDENHQDCPLVLSVEGCSCGDATRDEIATGDDVGDLAVHNVSLLSTGGFRWAITVSLPMVRCPISTSTCVPTGR